MSTTAHGLGGPRNGMQAPGGYVYRGTGHDTLTPPGVMAAWNNQVRALAGITAEPRTREELERLAATEREAARHAAERKPVDYWPAHYPGPGVPGRCPDCGYLRTAPGHTIACGGEA